MQTSSMPNKQSVINTGCHDYSGKELEKATSEFGQTQLETALAFAGFVGTAFRLYHSLKSMKEGATNLLPNYLKQ